MHFIQLHSLTFQLSVIESHLCQLHVHISTVNQSIESTSNSIIGLMPTIMNESSKLTHQAELLKSKLTSLEKEIKSESIGFDHEKLDHLKKNLENAKSFLEQSDSFTKLTNELEEMLENETKDIDQVCEKLYALRKLNSTQIGAASNSDRESQIEEFTNRVEEVLTKKAFDVLNEKNRNEINKIIEVFTKIDRLQSMKNIYINFQREMFARKWLLMNESSSQMNLNLLNEFYMFLLNEWDTQCENFWQFFNTNGICEIIFIFIETLNSLKTERESLVSSILKTTDDDKYEIMLMFSENNMKFAEKLKEKIDETQAIVPQFLMEKLAQSIFEFYNIVILQYISMEQSQLNVKLDEMSLVQSNFNDTVRILEDSVRRTFEIANDILDRQTRVTDDCAIINIISILNSFFNSVLIKIKKSQTQLEQCLKDQNVNLQSCIASLNIFGVFLIELDKIDERVRKIILDKAAKEIENRYFFGYNFVRQSDLNEFRRLAEKASTNQIGKLSAFENLTTPIDQQCKAAHEIILSLIFSPIESFLSNIRIESDSSYSPDLPEFSFTQNEYITGIGE